MDVTKMTNASAPNPWLVIANRNPQASLRLFCFPYSGGTASIYRNWAASLLPQIEVCAVQLPGRASRMKEAPYKEYGSLVRAIAQELVPYFDKPFAFFGHSMGALLSFELARALRREHGRLPLHLFVSGRHAPQLPAAHPGFHALPDAEFIEALRSLNGTPQEVLDDPELRELIFPLLRADFAVNETYVYYPEPPLECPIDAFGGLQDKDVRVEDLKAWRQQTSAAFRLRMLPGDHFFLHTNEAMLLQALMQELYKLARDL